MKKVMRWSMLDIKQMDAEKAEFTVRGESLKTMNGVTDELTVDLKVQIDTKYILEKFCNQVVYSLDSFTPNKDGELSRKAEIMYIPWSEGKRQFEIDVTNSTPWNCIRESGVVTASATMRTVDKMSDTELSKFREMIEAKMTAIADDVSEDVIKLT